MNIIEKNSYLNNTAYMCSVFKKVKSLQFENLILSLKTILKDFFYCIYKYIGLKLKKNVLRNAKIAKSSYRKIKKNVYKKLNNEYIAIQDEKLGGPGVKIQSDETVISRGFLVENPSNTDDETKGIIWLIEIIEENSKKN